MVIAARPGVAKLPFPKRKALRNKTTAEKTVRKRRVKLQAWLNEVDWRPMSEIPADAVPDAVITHDGVGEAPPGVLRIDLGEQCDREQLPSVLPVG